MRPRGLFTCVENKLHNTRVSFPCQETNPCRLRRVSFPRRETNPGHDSGVCFQARETNSVKKKSLFFCRGNKLHLRAGAGILAGFKRGHPARVRGLAGTLSGRPCGGLACLRPVIHPPTQIEKSSIFIKGKCLVSKAIFSRVSPPLLETRPLGPKSGAMAAPAMVPTATCQAAWLSRPGCAAKQRSLAC